MVLQIEYNIVEDLITGKRFNQVQLIFDDIISDLKEYLNVEPVYDSIKVQVAELEETEHDKILDIGVNRTFQDRSITIEINSKHVKFLPFILLREAYYCFIPKDTLRNELIKVCINQIVENDLPRLSTFKEWKKIIRDSLVNRDFITGQLDKLEKFFKIQEVPPTPDVPQVLSVVQFFVKLVREEDLTDVTKLYDFIYERYEDATSKSLFSWEIIETLRVFLQIFEETKEYLSLTDYKDLFTQFKEAHKIQTELSGRKFYENMQWINKHKSIAPSYFREFSRIGIYVCECNLIFNPLLEKHKIKKLLDQWSFRYGPKTSENSFAREISELLYIPETFFKDFKAYIDKLESFGYIVEKSLMVLEKRRPVWCNLNYFLDFSNTIKFTDPKLRKYEKTFEIYQPKNIEVGGSFRPINLFEFLLFLRVGNLSVVGLTFDKRIETLNSIKEEIENEYRKQTSFIEEFTKSFYNVLENEALTQQFLQFLEKNSSYGFYYIYDILGRLNNLAEILQKVLDDNPNIKNIQQLESYLEQHHISSTIENHIEFKDKEIRKILFRDIIPAYFKSKISFKEKIKEINLFYKVLDSCVNLKILNPKSIITIINEPNRINEIKKIKEMRLGSIWPPQITNQKIESTIKEFLDYDPPVIIPMLINTILTSTFAKYYPIAIVEDTSNIWEEADKFCRYLPRGDSNSYVDVFTNKIISFFFFWSVNIKEKGEFISAFLNTFKENVISLKHYYWRGVTRLPSNYQHIDFYDFENGEFVYISDYFKQLFTYTEDILGPKINVPSKKKATTDFRTLFWNSNYTIANLVDDVKNRISRQIITYNVHYLERLSNFTKNLENTLVDYIRFNEVKNSEFFNSYISSIKFIPALRKFGFSQYYLFFQPRDWDSMTFKGMTSKEQIFRLLFINTFQKVKYPACIESSPRVFISYFFPYRTPNKSYLDWLTTSKNAVNQYCLFFKKKVYDILQFDKNLTDGGWNYSANRFKSYLQKILFDPTYSPLLPNIRTFNIDEAAQGNVFGVHSPEFEELSMIYSIRPADLKSFLGIPKFAIYDKTIDLLKKRLIFPYITLKNLDFQDKISIILPNINHGIIDKILQIFSFFNMCRVYEIEGEFYIYGFGRQESFENGLLIEIWFPKCELDEFLDVFDTLFEYFEIKHYLILTDLVDGTHLIKSVYGNLDFLKKYNPLKNLKWNEKDKIWMNHKLFTEKFEPIYPELVPKNPKI